MDFIMLGAVVGLVTLGLLMIHSTTCGSPCPGLFPLSSWAIRQGTFAVLGLILLTAVGFVDYQIYRTYAYHLFGLGAFLLIIVLMIGRGGVDNDYGATRWINLGFVDVQPSEVAKLATVVVLARVLGDQTQRPLPFGTVLVSLAVVLVPFGLVFLQPDLGTAISFLVLWVSLLLVAGIRRRHALLMIASAVGAMPLAWFVMRDYMRERVATFIGTIVDVEHAAFDEGYNVLQARISIGSGGLFGRGYLEGTQTQLDYLRVKHSDFIFSALAEELGFVGAVALLTLFLVLLLRTTRAADYARDEFGRMVAFGIATMLLFQVVVNLGANLTLLPVTGIPLPFLSYGRTALLTNLVALGMVQSVLIHRFKYRY